jgi:hypothetical protein
MHIGRWRQSVFELAPNKTGYKPPSTIEGTALYFKILTTPTQLQENRAAHRAAATAPITGWRSGGLGFAGARYGNLRPARTVA